MDDEEQNQEKLSVSEGEPKPEEMPQEQTVFKATRNNLQLPRRLFHLANGTIIATLYLFYIEHNVAVHIIGVGVCLFYIFEQLRVKYPEYADSFSKVSSYFYRAEEQLKESAMIPYAMGLLLTILSF